jgi:hypothetical protein
MRLLKPPNSLSFQFSRHSQEGSGAKWPLRRIEPHGAQASAPHRANAIVSAGSGAAEVIRGQDGRAGGAVDA